jgi:hypothetical protein
MIRQNAENMPTPKICGKLKYSLKIAPLAETMATYEHIINPIISQFIIVAKVPSLKNCVVDVTLVRKIMLNTQNEINPNKKAQTMMPIIDFGLFVLKNCKISCPEAKPAPIIMPMYTSDILIEFLTDNKLSEKFGLFNFNT